MKRNRAETKAEAPYRDSKWKSDDGSVSEFEDLFRELLHSTGWNLANRRREKRLTRDALASLVGISTEQLKRIEFGAEAASIELMFAMCMHLSVPIDQVVTRRSTTGWGVLEDDAWRRFCALVDEAIRGGKVSVDQIDDIASSWKKREQAPIAMSRHLTAAVGIAVLVGIDIIPFLPDTFNQADLPELIEFVRAREAEQAAIRARYAERKAARTKKAVKSSPRKPSNDVKGRKGGK